MLKKGWHNILNRVGECQKDVTIISEKIYDRKAKVWKHKRRLRRMLVSHSSPRKMIPEKTLYLGCNADLHHKLELNCEFFFYVRIVSFLSVISVLNLLSPWPAYLNGQSDN